MPLGIVPFLKSAHSTSPAEFLAERAIIAMPGDFDQLESRFGALNRHAIRWLQAMQRLAIHDDRSVCVGRRYSQLKNSLGGIHDGANRKRVWADGRYNESIQVLP